MTFPHNEHLSYTPLSLELSNHQILPSCAMNLEKDSCSLQLAPVSPPFPEDCECSDLVIASIQDRHLLEGPLLFTRHRTKGHLSWPVSKEGAAQEPG